MLTWPPHVINTIKTDDVTDCSGHVPRMDIFWFQSCWRPCMTIAFVHFQVFAILFIFYHNIQLTCSAMTHAGLHCIQAKEVIIIISNLFKFFLRFDLYSHDVLDKYFLNGHTGKCKHLMLFPWHSLVAKKGLERFIYIFVEIHDSRS